jgi:hypothetical protein
MPFAALLALLLAAIWPLATAWSCDGHMAVAQIALDSGIMSSKAIAAANDLVSFLTPQYPKSGPTFQEIACWADDIKAAEPTTRNWHYIDIPVCKLTPASRCTQPPTDDNAVWAIDTSDATLEEAAAARLDKARALRFAVHFVGDIHQPLHAASYFSPQFPTGDAGGNAWKISGAPPATELHALWDEGAGQWTQNLRRPLNASGFDWLTALSAKVMGLHPVASLQPQIAEHNVTAWAYESNAIAADFVYTAPQAPARIPPAYLQQADAIILRQVAIAGYRLAAALELILAAEDPKDVVYTRVLHAPSAA